MPKLLIDVPTPIKTKLEALRKQGYTMNGFIVALLERELNGRDTRAKKG